ncbi:sulfite oxidase heme-binding subunit YedZ [Paracoccus sp. SCSIO 75233]|uniref:sulfite oxidase heme-binding subunit YedZ n=1 Tax=Paracoccus sp. SCSIO 75233 TaxID=3017782 RepID=UPI0022F13818|nr:protein-methionine-sulfoxide reductase heme-binding subunit MsrQ [Paracoccus sp. SCSIO 75233]WBU52969.1 sulfoxide reductase heme-binding subunit YedZ [Paracoccus sp. SCSIO 75233]
MQRVNQLLRRIPGWAVWLVGALPLALLIYDVFAGRLGVDPVRDIEHRLGRTALYFLIGSLAVTPVRRIFRINATHLRRALGLLCFSYAALHMAAWVVFDMGLLWSQMLKDVLKRPYLLFGMLSLLILIALAVTSNRISIRRMGRNWQKLHKLVYAAAILACLHWLWALKLWSGWPLFCTGLILFLLALRLPKISRSISNYHSKTVS